MPDSPPSWTRPSSVNCKRQRLSRTNYISIDFENVQESDLDRIVDKPVKVVLDLGDINRKGSMLKAKG